MKIEMKGLNELTNNLDQLKKAIGSLDGEIAKVHFDPHDQSDVDRAIREMDRIVDDKVAPYHSNPAVQEITTGLKQEFRKGLLKKAEEARRKLSTPAPVPDAAAGETAADDEPLWNMIHPAIAAIAQKKFDDGHFADAVETALKEVNKRVKEHVRAKLGKEYDGADLMNRAFSPQSPVIILGDLNTDTGKNMQQGYMQIFAGSMTGIRNPEAHENISIDSVQAIHFLFLASLLMEKLDEAKVPALPAPAYQPISVPPKNKTQAMHSIPAKSAKETLRDQMLLLVAAHEDAGSATYLSDQAIADQLNIDLREVQKQLLILEDNGLLNLSKAMGPSYGARLEAAGLAKVEVLQEAAKTQM
jgi:uncharacterized protein (TIGR02391 family)